MGGHSVRLLSLVYAKHTVYRPPLIHDFQELKQRLITALTAIEKDFLERVWQELGYRIDVCRATRGAHIESFLID
jgi:hypothetical protein